jgi:hypothetical protein
MKKILICHILGLTLVIGSCIYQNNPLEPNQPPTIVSVTPEVTYFNMTAPDSCTFLIRASDPDGDQVQYSFWVNDSLVTTRNEFMFRAVAAGSFTIRAEARDIGRKAVHEWFVSVFKKENRPPEIIWWYPEQSTVACAVGDTLEFHVRARDPNGDTLRYSFYLDSHLLHTGSPDLINRFMQQGDFSLDAVASDGQLADTIRWNVSVTGFPDTIAPAPILDLTGGPGAGDGSIELQWTAPGDDGNEGRAAAYMVRTSIYPILTEQDWKEASSKIGEPIPSPAGTREHMVIENLVSASYVYVTMRSIDDFFNLSPLGNCAKVLARGIDVQGRVIDAVTGQPIQGVYVSNGGQESTTDADGNYALLNIPSYSSQIVARDEKVGGNPGDYYDVVMPIVPRTQSMEMNFALIPVCCLRNVVQPDVYQGRFIVFFKEVSGTLGDLGKSTVYYGWNHSPITVYNPPMVYKDVDLQAEVRAAMNEWEDSTGIDLFSEVPTPDGADVLILYDSTIVERHHVTTVAVNGDGTPARREVWFYFLNHEAPIELTPHKIIAHEFGHVIGLQHSRNLGHLLVGLTTPQVDHVTTDEANVVKILYHYPNFFDFKNVLEE